MNVIGDIAGQYEALMALLKKMPDDEPVSLGDMNDRGPQSKEVLDFFMKNGRAIRGNHEHMLAEYFKNNEGYYKGGYYERELWTTWNGGDITYDQIKDDPMPYVEFINGLPAFIEEDGYFLSHAPLNPSIPFELWLEIGENAMDKRCNTSYLWNRGAIRRKKGVIQLHGHEAKRQVQEWRDKEGVFGYSIDTSRADKLTGYSTITKQFYEQEYI